MVAYEVLVKTQGTPNPLAIKFVVNSPIKMVGKATFTDASESGGLKLAEDLFAVDGVLQLYMFENVVTVTFSESCDREKLKEDVSAVLKTRMAIHDPNFQLANEKKQSS